MINLQKIADSTQVKADPFLHRLADLGGRVRALFVRGNLHETSRQPLLDQLAEEGVLEQMIDKDGILDLGRARSQVETTGKISSLREYEAVLLKHSGKFARSKQLGNLFLYKAIWRARIELYIAGEKRAADQPDHGIAAVKDFLEFIAKKFPFITTGDDQKIKSDIEILSRYLTEINKAAKLLDKNNNPATNAVLLSLTDDLDKLTMSEANARIEQLERLNGPAFDQEKLDRLLTSKIAYLGGGKWLIRLSGYHQTRTGLLIKESQVARATTATVMRVSRNIIENIDQEISKNEKFLAELAEIAKDPSGKVDALEKMAVEFRRYNAPLKEKAAAEIEGSARLIRIGSEQAVKLGKSLINLATRDMKLRQKELAASRPRFTDLFSATERLIGKQLNEFSDSIVKPLSYQGVLKRIDYLTEAKKRVDGFLQELKGEIKEEWFKTARERIEKVSAFLAEELTGIENSLAEKSRLLEEARLEHIEYSRQYIFLHNFKVKDDISRAKLESLRNSLVEKLKRIAATNDQLYKKILFIVVNIQMINNDYFSRDALKVTEDDYIAANNQLWDAIRTMSGQMQEIGIYLPGKNAAGKRNTEVWGSLTSMDIKEMALQPKAIGIFKRSMSS